METSIIESSASNALKFQVVRTSCAGSILPMLYKQLLSTQIPNFRKRQSSHQYLFTLLGSARIKAARKTLVKFTPCWALVSTSDILRQVKSLSPTNHQLSHQSFTIRKISKNRFFPCFKILVRKNYSAMFFHYLSLNSLFEPHLQSICQFKTTLHYFSLSHHFHIILPYNQPWYIIERRYFFYSLKTKISACRKCRQPVSPDESCPDHDCDFLASLGDLNDEVQIRYQSLIPRLGMA